MKNDNGIFILDNPIEDKENGYVIDKIDLNKISDFVVVANSKMEGIVLNNVMTPIVSSNDDNMRIEYNIEYDGEHVITSGTVYQQDTEQIYTNVKVDSNTVIAQLIDAVSQNNKKLDIAKLPVIASAIDVIQDTVYKKAFESNILLAKEEYNYKINLYKPGTSEIIGIANRMFIQHKTLVLMEAILFSDQYSLDKVDIKVILDKEHAIYIKDLSLDAKNGKAIRYCSYNMMDAKISKITEQNDDTKMRLKGLKLPYKNMSTITMESQLISSNEQNMLIKCFKQNKRMNIVTIDINKYLLM